MKKFGINALLIVLAMVIAACGSNNANSSQEPIKVYTHNDSEEMQDLVKGLKEETGIEVDVLRMSSGEAWSRIESESPNFGAEMQWGMLHSFALKAEQNDFLESYHSPTWEDVPDNFKDPDGKWYGWSYWFNLLAINTDILESKGLDKPESWEDLLDPQYEGEIVLPDPGTSGTAFLFVSTIMQIMGEEEGWKYLEKLDQNVAQYTKSGSAPAQMVAQGEYAIGITWDQAVFDRVEEGYPVEAVFPTEGVGYDLDVIWMFKDAENQDQVKEIIDYIGSENGMEEASKHRSMVTKPGFVGTVENIDQYLIDYDAVWAAENRERVMEEWRTKFSN
ncbi:ABC transporter substrate-binding protein [Salirhabdus salicampi]|uniref:ABC transporter substrate-binding protein n=1 Tax=Salirhabdus salicampi TaxID=476102 RepID=UPI0020C2239A|nr:extracellular solute-binding protein [Salirhabdus salicampi]MCP8615841.1 extracellular solute-binding protein [Salirhabdus salicampi]